MSLLAGVQRARTIWRFMFSERKRTWPSPNRASTPPGCVLNGSSLGPQLLADHGQFVGPPMGVFQLFTTWVRVPATYRGDAGSCVGGPETPLPLSGSAQRFGAPNVPPPRAVPGGRSAAENSCDASNELSQPGLAKPSVTT